MLRFVDKYDGQASSCKNNPDNDKCTWHLTWIKKLQKK